MVERSKSGTELCSRVEMIIRSDEGLTLETSAIVSFTASITLINTQLIHQFVFRRADAVTQLWHYTTSHTNNPINC